MNLTADAGAPPGEPADNWTLTPEQSRPNGHKPAVKKPDSIWDIGVGMLVRSGMTEGNARNYLGGLCSKYGKEEVGHCCIATSANDAVDPRSYLAKLLENRKSGNGMPRAAPMSKTEATFQAGARRMAALQAQIDAQAKEKDDGILNAD